MCSILKLVSNFSSLTRQDLVPNHCTHVLTDDYDVITSLHFRPWNRVNVNKITVQSNAR